MQRRDFLATMAAGLAVVPSLHAQGREGRQGGAPAPGGRAGGRGGTPYTPGNGPRIPRKGRIRQSAFTTVFGDLQMTFEDQCREAVRIGLVGFELVQPANWPTLKKYGLVCTCAPSTGVTFENGVIHTEDHDRTAKAMGDAIDVCAANGVERMITVGGMRRGMSNEEATDNAVRFFNRMKAHAEDKGVTIALEIMNTRYPDNRLGRPDQVFDHLDWGVNVMKQVNSPRMKVLFDIYHVQIADGNVVARLKDAYPYVSHFHTAGVPGRNEIDETQEINYRFIAQTLADMGCTWPVAHEFRPTPGKDPIKSLEKCVELMDV
jgi:hydroxypyruvate isomerase